MVTELHKWFHEKNANCNGLISLCSRIFHNVKLRPKIKFLNFTTLCTKNESWGHGAFEISNEKTKW